MNNEEREEQRVETQREDDLGASEATSEMMNVLQDEVDALRIELNQTQNALANVQQSQVASTPVGDADLQALAATVRQCQRNGHPDSAKHMDALLKALGV